MLPCNSGGHAAYQAFVLSEIFTHYPDPFSLSKNTWETIIEFWHLDLCLTDTLMLDHYSKRGPAPRLPSCMLHSYLLSLKFRITSITRWVSLLKENPLYAILSVFSFGNVPGIGTFYDFFSRLWDSDSNNLSPKECHLEKLLLDSAMDAIPVYEYCKTEDPIYRPEKNE